MHIIEQKVLKYIEKHSDIFSKLEKSQIINYIKNIKEPRLIPDVIKEVYDELDIFPESRNIDLGFINLIGEKYPIQEKRIIEVGGGKIPRLGKRISKKVTTGKITVYDPKISHYESDTTKLKLVREKFNIKTDVSNTDLLIGLMACEAGETIIDSALENNIDFIIALCEGGPHGDEYDFYEDEEEWLSSLIRYTSREVNDRSMGKLKFKYMKEYNNPYPVIYNDRG